jgi:hypothetical protein
LHHPSGSLFDYLGVEQALSTATGTQLICSNP